MWMEIPGFIGVVLILSAYFSVQLQIISSQQYRFSLLNLVGASLVLISLLGSENYAAMLLEAAWIIISLLGLIKTSKNKLKSPI